MEVELEKMPLSLEMEAGLVVLMCLGAEVELQKIGVGDSQAK